jgi:hypothetical protein
MLSTRVRQFSGSAPVRLFPPPETEEGEGGSEGGEGGAGPGRRGENRELNNPGYLPPTVSSSR